MIEEDDEASVISLEDEQLLSAQAFAHDAGLPDALQRQVIKLAHAQRLGDSSKLLFEMARSEDAERRLRILVTFISHVEVSKDDAKPVAAVMAKLAPLLLSSTLEWLERQTTLDRVLCHLDRLIRRFAALEASSTASESLCKVREHLREQSANADLFKALADAPAHDILKRALKHGNKHLGAALVCMQPLSAARYAQLMLDSAATTLRRTVWINELRRLHKADLASFVKVGEALLLDPDGLAECSLMLASILYTDDQDEFESAMKAALQCATKTAPLAFATKDLLFSLRILAKLYHLLDCAERGNNVALPACLSGRWVYQSGRITHRKLLKALRAELDRALKHADEETCRLWRTARDWLKCLDAAPGVSSSSSTHGDRPIPPSALRNFALDPGLLQQVVDLATSAPPETVEKDLAKLALGTHDLADRLLLLAAFVFIADADRLGLKPLLAAISKIAPLLESNQIRSWQKQEALVALLCAMVRLLRKLERLQADARYVETLNLLFRQWRKYSSQSKLFRALASIDSDKCLEHALQHRQLSIGLACYEAPSVSRYASFMVDSGAALKHRADWMYELQRLYASDLPTCLAVASWLVADSARLPECALLLACVTRAADRRAFEIAISTALEQVHMPYGKEDLIFTLKVLATLYATVEAAGKSNWDHFMAILGAYWHLSERQLTHGKPVGALIVQLDALMLDATHEAFKYWCMVKTWLQKLATAKPAKKS